jgi:hypothetical protein
VVLGVVSCADNNLANFTFVHKPQFSYQKHPQLFASPQFVDTLLNVNFIDFSFGLSFLKKKTDMESWGK